MVECKNGYDVQLDDLFKHKSDFKSFIKQAQSDAAASNKKWLVVYQKTRRMAIVVVSERYKVSPELVLDNKYYIYPLEQFLQLPDEVFYS